MEASGERAPGTVAVTGVSGYIGSRLVAQAREAPGETRIVGLDVREPVFDAPNLTFHQRDVRDPELATLLRDEDVEALVHLAFHLDPIKDEERMRAVNVDGTRNVLEAVEHAGVEHVVVASSATAYGAHPDNPERIPEDHALRGHEHEPSYYYSAHKVAQEELLDAFEVRNPEVTVTRLRPVIVMGPRMDNFISKLAEQGFLFGFPGSNPPFQFVHEDDVARAFWRALVTRAHGAFNIAAPDTIHLEEMSNLSGGRLLRLPGWVSFPLGRLLWALGVAPAPPGQLHFARHPWVVDVTRAREELGWEAQVSTRDAYVAMLEAKGLLEEDA